MQNKLFISTSFVKTKTMLYFSVLPLLSLALSLGFGALIKEWWAIPMLLLPSYYVSKAIIEGFVFAGHKHRPLERIDVTSNELISEKTAIVLYKALDKEFDSDALSRKLIKLSNSDSVANLKVLALIDLCPENAEKMGDDEFTIQSLSQMISKLNEREKDRYALIIRKRTFSDIQEEFVCPNGLRGALLELARYMYSGTGNFCYTSDNTDWLVGTRYITVVRENILPEMNAVSKLLSMALHPRNKARIENGKIKSGVGIITPNCETGLESSLSSGFSKVFGLKPEEENAFLSTFGVGEYSGYGIIDMYCYLGTENMIPFEKHVCPGIIEGEMIGCAYAPDVNFYKDFPDTPQKYYRHQALRASSSLQNLRLLFSKRLRLLSKAKLCDRFISSIVPIAVFANMFFAFLLYSPSAEFAALLALSMYLFPEIFEAIRLTVLKNDYEQQFYSGLLPSSVWAIKHVAYSVVMLPTLAAKTFIALLTTALKMLSCKKLMSQGNITKDPISFYILPEILSLALIASPSYAIRLLGIIFSLMPALLALSEQESNISEQRLSFKNQKELSQYIADSWRFFEEFVTSVDNGLPPDSVQFSPIYRIKHRTTPEGIGVYLLSCLGAYDQKLISIHSMSSRLEESINSLERMEKLSGCFYKSYDSLTLAPMSDEVICEGNGILLSSLVALKEGLDEIGEISNKAGILSERIERILKGADVSIFYDSKNMLMCKSVSRSDGQSEEKHSLLMDCARLMSFYSIANQNVPFQHWLRLGRITRKSGFYSGLGSPNGSLEEYFLPQMFIKFPEGSCQFESLKFALWSQKSLALKKGLPFGLSECFVSSFDHKLEYNRQTLGDRRTSVLNKTFDGYAVSAYSLFLALQYDPHGCMESLKKLKNAGGYSGYGFYESVDYTFETPHSVKCLSSKHVGEMIISGINALSDGLMQKRFMKNARMSGAWSLLEERFLPEQDRKKLQKKEYQPPKERFDDVTPIYPRLRLLYNDSYTLCVSDCGASIAFADGKDIYKRTFNPIYEKRGAFFGLKLEEKVVTFDSPKLCADFDESGVRYAKQLGDIRAEMKTCLHESLCCELRRFSFENVSDSQIDAELLIYLEPSLSTDSDMKLRIERDDGLSAVIVTRSDNKSCLAIGFTDKAPFSASFDKENVMAYSDSVKDAFENADNVPPSLICEPKPCVYIKAKLNIDSISEKKLDFYIMYAKSEDELRLKLSELLKSPVREYVPKNTAAQALSGIILPDILFNAHQNKKLSRISKDLIPCVPIISLILNDINDDEKMRCCFSSYKELRRAGFSVQLAVLFDDLKKPERIHYNKLLKAAQAEGVEQYIYSRGGIIPIDRSLHTDDVKTPILKASCYIFKDDIINDMPIRTPYEPIKIQKCQPLKVDIDEQISHGGFKGNDYVITSRPEVTWRHVLSNPVFSSIVTSTSIGSNSFGNFGEQLILELDDKYYDIINGAAACFSFGKAKYTSQGEGFRSEVVIEVSQKGICKRISVKITSQKSCRLAYICDFGEASTFIRQEENSAVFASENRFFASSSEKISKILFDKNAFFTGDWESEKNDGRFCAHICRLSGAESVCFYLSQARSEKAALKLPLTFSEQSIRLFGDLRSKWLKYQLLYANVYSGDEKGKMHFSSALQNACALSYFDHKRSRTEILRCCMHQLSEGGAQRTWRKGEHNNDSICISAEELMWLPYAVCEYIKITQDYKLLNVTCRYFEEGSSKESVYEHCRRAIDFCTSKTGPHGLVSDDDGNESTALSELLIITLKEFSEIAKIKGDNMYSATLLYSSKMLCDAIKQYCRDSGQYICGYTKFGEVIGSIRRDSGKIYLLPQVLAVLAELDEQFDKTALLNAFEKLHDKKRGLTKSFSPPYKSDDEIAPIGLKYLPFGICGNGSEIAVQSVLLSSALEKLGLSNEAESVEKSLYSIECAKMAAYKAEPYYVCGERYSNKNCFARGGMPIFNTAPGWLLRKALL